MGEKLFPQARRINEKISKPSDIGQVVSNTLVFALALVEKISECAPVPGLKGAVGGLRLFLDRFDVSTILSFQVGLESSTYFPIRMLNRICLTTMTSLYLLIN